MKASTAFWAALVLLARAYATDKRQTTGQTCIKQDIVYMIDSSQNIGIEQFLQQLEFVKNNIQHYNINPSCTRVGIVTYSQGAYNQFYLNGYTTQQQLLTAIGNIPYRQGTVANTAAAINFVTNTAFSTQHGARSGVPHYGILLTGSTSTSPTLTVSAANHARQNGVTLYTVGVGQGVNQGELAGVAKETRNQFTAQNFNSLNGLASPVATRVNGAVTPASAGSLGTPSSCMQQADIVFMVDGSGSIGAANFVKLENFVKNIVSKLDVGVNGVHVGLMQFSNYPSKEFPLSMYTSRQDVMTGIQNMKYMGGGTNTADAIRYMRENMFTQSSGARPNVPRIGVVITDGRSMNPAQTKIEADTARTNHIGMMAIGVGNGVDVNELHNIADDPDASNTFQVSNYDQLDGIVSSIVNRACQVRTTASSSFLSGPSSQGTGSISNDTCRDKLPNCDSYDASVCHGSYGPWAKDNCPRFCGYCTPTYTTAPPPCVDKLTGCASYEPGSCVGAYKGWAEDNCRKFCGYCDASAQSVGFYGTCYYKGKKYNQGEKWDDGCDYECTCENAQTGKYQCYNKCPVYYNLPNECTLVKSDTKCCLQPVCNFQPTLSSFEATSTGKTPDGTAVCVYKGHQYYQGQSWEDGCQYLCTCKNANVGTYKCQDSCPTYSSIPSYCHMVKQPGDCCASPVCEFKTQQGSFTGTGSISGKGVGQSPTAPPPCVDTKTDCDRYETGFCTKYQPWARDNCRKTCSLCAENTPNPGPTDVCMYGGSSFKQGQSWRIGCDTLCTCENAVYGYYRCVNSCPKYNNIPSGCTEVKKAGDCCTTIQCSNGKFYSSTKNLGTIGNGGLINVGNSGIQPTIPTGGIAPPGTGGTNFQAPSLKGCLYNGEVYSLGELWEVGCEYSCECQNVDTGLYTCNSKCPLFPNLPSECHLEADPNDACCQRPKCQFTGAPVPVPPVYRPSITGHNMVEPPSPSSLYHGTQNITQTFTIPANTPAPPTNPAGTGGIGYCVYKGGRYTQGQTWEDGCQYNCACEDASRGFYRCREKCPKYTNLPPQCHLEQDKNNTCCQVPNCTFQGYTTSMTYTGAATGPVLITTQQPQPQTTQRINACVYKGHYYSQGQSWFDACDYKCSCDDSAVGFYRCMRRCPEYFNVPPNCPYVTDPNDPTCCKVPQCTPTAPPGMTPVIPTIPPGTFVGQPNNTQFVGYCEYKGSRYRQGESWNDGCTYSCVCEDEAKGQYRCKDKCPIYSALPKECRLIPDFTNPCCMKPDCKFNPSTGQVTGSLTLGPSPGSPSQSPTPAPNLNVCVYKTAQYSQGQTWNDGCQYKCRCDDSSKGLYVCNDRCPKYQTPLPPQCKMETDPLDSCCQQPKCTFTPATGQISGTIAPYMLPTKLPGIISGQANTPAPTPRPDGTYPSPKPLEFCEYKGSTYRQDQTWDDGCDYNCRCVNAGEGRYECTEKCPRYTNIPSQCHLTKDAANPCCFKPVCDFPISVGQITGQNTPAPSPGQPTIAPNPNFTPNPTPYPTPGLPAHVCVYRNDKYTQGQQWFDGCNFKCTCEDSEKGIYRCSERCAKYTGLPAGCSLVSDPQDPLCCEVPQCTPVTNSSIPFPTAPPGHVTGGSVTSAPTLKPTPAPGVSTLQPPLNPPSPSPQPKAVCIYKGKQYTQGQRWQDGCDFNCVCKDEDTGTYDCTEMCPKYPNLPSQCHLVQDYMNPCCQTPVCDFTGTTGQITGQITLAPSPGGPTIAPSPGSHLTPAPGSTKAPSLKTLCRYNGVAFKQGQRWDDGCDLQCVCEDETTGYYRCNQRCAIYPNVPAGCTLITDPSDPCCRVPHCSPTPAPSSSATIAPSPGATGPTLAPGLNPTLAPGQTHAPTPAPRIPTLRPVIIGQGVTPTPMPGVSTARPPIPVCVYYGRRYGQGEKWIDGCQYECECIDAKTGQYRCSQKCAIYPQVPSNCRMVTDPADACCKIPECTQSPTPAPNPQATPGPSLQPGISTVSPPLSGSSLSPQPGIHTPNPQPTPVPQPKKLCVMNGVQYTKGQKWDDGCDKTCVCDDDTTGHYTCLDRCKSYTSIPTGCTMVADPTDPLCCQVPQCIPVPGTNGYPTPNPTDKPVIYTNAPHAVVTGTGTPPAPTAGPTPVTPHGATPGTTLVPKPRAEVCVYNSQQYLQDQRWRDGCKYDCICNDGKTGRYTCTERCGTYPNLPPQCKLQRDPKDYCCFVPICDWNKPTPNPYITPSPQSTISPQPGVSTISPQPGVSTISPQPGVSTNSPPQGITLAPKLSFCVYNGVPFKQGQVLDDGCSQRCRCDDADTNYYNCYDRCPNFPHIAASCVMVTDPQDSCCQIPKCNVIPTPGPNPYSTKTPTPGQHTTGVSPGVNPTLAPGMTPSPGPTPQPSPIPTAVPGQIISKPDPTRPPQQRGFCLYYGVKYTKGQKWDDGCTYNCECLDDMTGQYKCVERCVRFPSIPSYCMLVEDPNDRCCKIPSCPGLIPTPAPSQTPSPRPGSHSPTPQPGHPSPGMPGYTSPNPLITPVPIPTPQPTPVAQDVCIMNGKSYTEGQQWYDDCKQICVCDDGVTGHYTCNQRCPVYNNIQPTCVFVPDPKDPLCCQMPQCTSANSTIPTPIKGSITGGNNPTPTPRPGLTQAPTPLSPVPTPGPGLTYPPGMIPTPQPGITKVPNPFGRTTLVPGLQTTAVPAPKVCVYNGAQYAQGQTWRDGCTYDCSCDDADQGKYTCTDVCPRRPGLPTYCRMVYDPMNPCCEKPDCSTPAPSPFNTIAPSPGVSTQAPSSSPYPVPKTDFCVYNGIPLKKGSTFADGCDKLCRCEDTMTNKIVCDERCATYPPLQVGCTMITDPNDQCCQVPQCQPTNPSTSPNATIITGVPGTITGSNLPNPNPGSQPITGTRNACLYHGVVYKSGDKWDDGCTYNCECIDGMTGSYRCTQRCARYPSIPSFCTMVQDPNDACCREPKCQYIAPTPVPRITPSPQPGVSIPTPSPGSQTAAPSPGSQTASPRPGNPTPAPSPGAQPTPAPRVVCQYKNQLYRQDQVWYDDCNAICKCEDASVGYYRCQERCGRQTNIPPSCTLVPDPKDPSCCKVASCPLLPTVGPTPTPGYLPPNPNTPAPPIITGLAPVPTPGTSYPSPSPGGPTLAPSPGGPTQAPSPKTGCYYNGVVHNKGDKFDDGCKYNCECIDDMTGQYQCSQRCADYPNLPPQCVLVTDPKDSCCKVPYCDYVNPTPFPHGIPTQAPQPTPSPRPGQPTPSPGPTLAPVAGYCVYKGVYYTQGQQWQDGCDKKCRCEDVVHGYISCSDRCPSYANYASNCVLRTDPNDNCCLVPDCNNYVTPTPGPSVTNPSITFNPGVGPTSSGSNPPQVIVYPTSMPGTFTGTSGYFPSGTGTQTGPSGKTNACVYKSTIYKQGDKWADGCSYNCECVDETRGQYRCTERCPHYINVPPQCTYLQDPNDQCCKVAVCNMTPSITPTPKPNVTPSQGVYTVSPGSNTGITGTGPSITFNPGHNTGFTGQHSSNIHITPTPYVTPSHGGNTISTSPTTDQCVYTDKSLHRQGTTWQDGCDYVCFCDDASTNSYKCNARCQIFADIPPSCHLIPDPKDNCCKVPECSGSLTPMIGGPTSGNPTLSPSITNVVPIGTHTSFTGSGRPSIIPGLSSSGSRSVCYYKGTIHRQGESWDDGCDYTCTCTDSTTGLYTCTSKCPNYPAIPSYCKKTKVPGLCCPALSCNSPQIGNYNPAPGLVPTPAPSLAPGQTPNPPSLQIYPSGTQTMFNGTQYPGGGYALPQGVTSGNIRNQCIYKNKLYNFGEKWDDGCDYQCECLDGRSGYYQCKPRCPTYTLPTGCFQQTTPGQCCAQPVCQGTGGRLINPLTNPTSQYPVYGTYSSGMGGFRPGYNPSFSSSSQTSGFGNRCIYKGHIYTQGQSWDDGCDYTCQCTDAQHGQYTCYDKCKTYTKLPATCHMANLPGQCCQVPECNQSIRSSIATPHIQTTVSPLPQGCVDALSNCAAYGVQACQDPYKPWANQNCKAYCRFCNPSVTPTSAQCADKISSCAAYGQTACTGIYEPWARDNCRQYCNLCSSSFAPITPTRGSQTCVDKIANCADYGTGACVAPYQQWAAQNCMNFCGMCSGTGVTSGPFNGQTPTNNWMIMMKGVAGVPGNLYQLWNGRNTINANVPQAMYLTSQYPGHYKPDTSNHWRDLCIDKVKVAIFNNGVEKANIIFDATGADKNSWFEPSRIISSTWTDIKYAPKNLFSLLGDPSTGRQFYASSSGNGCNAQGWIMVSTQSGCTFEQGSQKPAFYYAPGQTAANWGNTTPGTGDVFAILAHSNCGNVVTTAAPASFTGPSLACIYKNSIYSQGDTWQDGCQYNCTCEDARTGFYRCRDLCTVWTNLPSGCTLQKPAGECCAKPVCPGSQTGGLANRTNTCYYGNKYYHQGEHWRDGCKYDCHCVDGTSGQYQCNALCLQWSNLPSVCTMTGPAPGKCCAKPSCPSYVQLQYPAGYVEPVCTTPCSSSP